MATRAGAASGTRAWERIALGGPQGAGAGRSKGAALQCVLQGLYSYLTGRKGECGDATNKPRYLLVWQGAGIRAGLHREARSSSPGLVQRVEAVQLLPERELVAVNEAAVALGAQQHVLERRAQVAARRVQATLSARQGERGEACTQSREPLETLCALRALSSTRERRG